MPNANIDGSWSTAVLQTEEVIAKHEYAESHEEERRPSKRIHDEPAQPQCQEQL